MSVGVKIGTSPMAASDPAITIRASDHRASASRGFLGGRWWPVSVAPSGVHKPSLYRTFGSKDELFATVLRRYLAQRMAAFAELVERAGPRIAGIHAFLDDIRTAEPTESGRNGCLLVVASIELAGSMPGYENSGAEYRGELRRHLGVLVARAQPEGEPDRQLAEARAEVLVTFLLGLHVTIRASAGTGDVCLTVRSTRSHAVVDTWRD